MFPVLRQLIALLEDVFSDFITGAYIILSLPTLLMEIRSSNVFSDTAFDGL